MVVRRLLFNEGRRNDFPYYRQVWIRVVLALLTVSLIPLIVIGGGVSSYTFEKIESFTLDALRAQVRKHQQAIDHFLTERLTQLKLIAALHSLDELTAPGRLQSVFDTLKQQMPGFADLGVIDLQGRHRAYAGPYALLSREYDQEEWFRRLMEQDSYISDVYLGHRQIPHFIMAVKHVQGDNTYILRATVDSDDFDALVAGGPGEFKADAFIINREGVFQTRSRISERLMTPSGIRPDPHLKGIHLEAREDLLVLTLWQEKVPWLSVVQVRRNDIYGNINRARLAVILTFIIGSVAIAATVLLTTGNLVGRLETKGQRLRMLNKQLRRSSYLSSSMELTMGFFEEVRDILSNIDVSVQWLVNHDLAKNEPDLMESLYQIAGEASRGHALFDKFVGFVRAEDPIITDMQINELLDDLLVFLNRILEQRNIRIIRDYQPSLAPLRSDRRKLRQVFQNLMLNAIAALSNGGRIHLISRAGKDAVIVVVSDNGPGIADGDHEKIFEPLYTTKPQGTGLGLPICKAILDQLGGTITVESRPGQGAAFSVKIPRRMNGQG